MRKSIIAAIVIVVLIAAFGGYYYYTMRPSQTAPVTLTIAQPYEPVTLDPAVCASSEGALVTRGVYEGLVRCTGNTTEIEPWLATSWNASTDSTVWTFNLKQNVKFQDGTPLNASAVKFSFDRLLSIGLGPAWMFSAINETEVLDNYTVRFTLSKPFAPFLATLASMWGPLVVSPSYVISHQSNETELGQTWMYDHACGSGPYVLQNWAHESEIVMTKNPDYWGGWSGNHLDKIVIKIVTESATARLLLEKGEIDIADMSMKQEDMIAEQNNTDIILQNNPSTQWVRIVMNPLREPLNDTRVRQAMAYAFDYNTTVNTIFSLTGVQAEGPVTKASWGHNPNSFMYSRNLTKARELLAEAGFPNGGFTINLAYLSTRSFDRALSLLLQSNLAELNITLDMQGYQWTELRPLETNKDKCPHMYLEVWYSDYEDPDDWYRALYYSGSWGANGWNAYYKNATVDQLIDQASVTPDLATRKSLYYQMEAMIIQDAPGVLVVDQIGIIPMRTWVKGQVGNPAYMYTFKYYDMYISGRS